MKREVKIHRFSGKPDTATIIIDKNGLRVENKSYPDSDDKYCIRYIGQLLDMDAWKLTWHMNVDNVRWKGSEERKFAREKLNEKIKQREEEIQMLKDGLQILSRLNINTN
ncbi:hypothetical protein [Vibrio phage JSF13]|jgi:hypothetical protein|uniref:Uncharacterized protein ORF34 n=1 Tax=Vibrio phage ICP1 TaxID=979525 RepID=F1D156_9CAUD|nr:hypothetical protein ViPhICP1_gp034 [Vibrio phage ICP1]ADX88077.1 hypothetical protein TUST1-191_00155 [Vibrio phage ICP1_2006_D]ADX88304.1 hypothetical protein TUST1-182_00155 [Vibrio phage ICP1_2006_C]ADX88531.1 hypothetical protein TUST1-159_00155 [Vibrio phage ICP1_2006_B]ADX88757.1 hypothetical protein TUST1-17_00155 [Vibrio phage ICP1_2006_A]ADX88983.1 hypothetical protein TUST1-15_00155 [Vibrio phage ICP1_2005_A]ADX89215.1 hypothetical protein TUST1-2_00165 [Vibrio phage ICP1_2001_A